MWLDTLLAEGQHANRLANDLPYFAEHCLKLRPKSGSLAPFIFNHAQLELHRRIEEQKVKTGKVRAIILKARQLGISTYVSARVFHRCIFEPGLRTFILGHEKRASTNLFEMVKRFYEHLPEGVRPATGTFNAEREVAGMMTREIRLELKRGPYSRVTGFSGPIPYPKGF